MTDYPLCRQAGLSTHAMGFAPGPHHETIIWAADVEALLANAPVVTCADAREYCDKAGWIAESVGIEAEGRTHTARLLLIEPIVRDTAESLLREVLNCANSKDWGGWSAILDRARKLLGGK